MFSRAATFTPLAVITNLAILKSETRAVMSSWRMTLLSFTSVYDSNLGVMMQIDLPFSFVLAIVDPLDKTRI